MQRRKAIQQLALLTGAALILPSCLHDKSKSSILLKNLSIDGGQEKLIAELCECIIPRTDTPGAKDISAHLFALMMVDDCYKAEDRKKFVNGLQEFELNSTKRFNKSFVDYSDSEKKIFLDELEEKRNDNTGLAYFYSTVKRLTVQAYTTSKFYLTKIQVYELVPGHYYGCVPVKKVS